jgi:ABC-2 type transport system permease protein
MFADIWTIMWKEWKGLFREGSNRRSWLLLGAVLVFLLLSNPLRDGPAWLRTEESAVMTAILCMVLAINTVANSFAGEREWHTLETLLANRLPDRAILFGKVAASVALSFGATIAYLAIGVAIVNVVHGGGGFLFFPPVVIGADLALGFLLPLMFAGAGVLASLRAATVQGATQMLMVIFLLPPVLLTMALVMFRGPVMAFLSTLDAWQVLAVAAGVLAVLDASLLVAAMARFQRARLVLD